MTHDWLEGMVVSVYGMSVTLGRREAVLSPGFGGDCA